MSSATVIPNNRAGRTLEKKELAKEDRALDRVAQEAQAFLLNNQKKQLSDTSSVTSVGKGTVKSVATTKSISGRVAAKQAKDQQSIASSSMSGMKSFSRQGKALNSKNI